MNQIVPLRKTGAVSKRAGTLSPLAIAQEVHELDSSFESLEEILKPVWCAKFKYYVPEPTDAVRKALPELLEFCNSQEGLATFLPAIEQAEEDADDVVIANQLKWLTTSWPNAARADMAGFAAMLAVDVKCAQPTRYGLASACMTLRRTSRFAPTIAEVLAAIREADERVRDLHLAASTLPRLLDELRASAAEEDNRQQIQREIREREQEAAREARRRENEEFLQSLAASRARAVNGQSHHQHTDKK